MDPFLLDLQQGMILINALSVISSVLHSLFPPKRCVLNSYLIIAKSESKEVN